MLKEMLKDREKNVYEALYNSIKNDRISSAYLFCGQTGSLKKEAAVLLAETIMCPKVKHDFACESCNTCRRIYESFYPKEEVKTTGALQPVKHADLIYLDGTKYPVSKEDVDAIQELLTRRRRMGRMSRALISRARCAMETTRVHVLISGKLRLLSGLSP